MLVEKRPVRSVEGAGEQIRDLVERFDQNQVKVGCRLEKGVADEEQRVDDEVDQTLTFFVTVMTAVNLVMTLRS